MKKLNLIIFIFAIYFLGINPCFAFPEKFVDDSGKTFIIKEIPKQVVSLVPGLTEIIFKLEAGKSLKGITYHTVFPSENSAIKIVGGFFNPSVNAIAELNPDVIFISSLHTEVREYFKNKDVKIIELGTSSVPDGIETIMLLGKIFNKKEKALQIKKELDDQIDLITEKLNFIDLKNRKRVMRLMGRDKVMTPG
ncbi:MAG: ABC transporter substrate-binding protein, partial [Desulfobulbaceae bacterium]|nr:ABC transporter substrate-binding protein [Desulfobulbaceae bacterium]